MKASPLQYHYVKTTSKRSPPGTCQIQTGNVQLSGLLQKRSGKARFPGKESNNFIKINNEVYQGNNISENKRGDKPQKGNQYIALDQVYEKSKYKKTYV